MHSETKIVVSAAQSGGTHTSRTMMLAELAALLAATPATASAGELRDAIIELNVLGKNTLSGRKRAHRYLRELYALDPQALSFRALRDLWNAEPKARPLLALLCALARDPLMRATAPAVLGLPDGAPLSSAELASAVLASYPTYSDAVAAKIGRNAASSWTQSGHLIGRANKKRAIASPSPAAVAYALLIGHTEGRRGQMLFETLWCEACDRPAETMIEYARRASQRGLLEFRHGGGVTEVGFRMLLRRFERGSDE